MAVADQLITDKFAIYNGDSMEVMQTMPDGCVGLSIYSPPFASSGAGGLYVYSSSDRDLSNCDSYERFMEHYHFSCANWHVSRCLAACHACTAWTSRAATAEQTAISTFRATSSSCTRRTDSATPGVT